PLLLSRGASPRVRCGAGRHRHHGHDDPRSPQCDQHITELPTAGVLVHRGLNRRVDGTVVVRVCGLGQRSHPHTVPTWWHTGLMQADYAVTTLPWAVVLSVLGLVLAWRAWRQRRRATAVARLGWAGLVWAVWLVALMSLVVEIGTEVANWAAGFVFRPSVWLGLAVGFVAIVLITVGSIVAGRGNNFAEVATSAK